MKHVQSVAYFSFSSFKKSVICSFAPSQSMQHGKPILLTSHPPTHAECLLISQHDRASVHRHSPAGGASLFRSASDCPRLNTENFLFQEPQTSTPGKPRALGHVRRAGYQFLKSSGRARCRAWEGGQGGGTEPWTGSLRTHPLSH